MREKAVRIIRIFQAGHFELGQTIELSEEAGHHVGVVLRMQLGMHLTLFCGDNREFQAIITDIRKKKVTVNITAVQTMNRESPRNIHLAQAISKGDRMEWVIQKAVELGVKSITPLITAHCAVKLDDARLTKKQQQWQAIAISACEQSGRNYVPLIHPVHSFESYLQHRDTSFKLILHPTGAQSFHDLHFAAGDITLLIGPEGGLSEEEVCRAKFNQFVSICLGPRILRTETAAIAALSILQAIAGDL